MAALESFNSQPPEGGWWRYKPQSPDRSAFQLTAARRRLGLVSVAAGRGKSFNSQPPEGGWVAADGCGQVYSYAFQLTAARRRLDISLYAFLLVGGVSTHSRPKAAGLFYIRTLNHSTVSTHSRPKAAGIAPIQHPIHHFKFQLTAARRRLAPLPNKRAGELKFQLTAARRRLVNHRGIIVFVAVVSTHSRPKAAGTPAANSCSNTSVSTHSRPKAAGLIKVLLIIGFSVSTHSRPKAAGLGRRTSLVLVARFNSQPPEGGWNLKLKNFLLH